MPLVVPPALVDEEGALTQECEDALVFNEDSLAEIREFFDLDDKNNLTLKGFLQMYNLQTSSEPEETWKDLQKHGYDTNLRLVASRNEDGEDKNNTTNSSRQAAGGSKKASS
ncbi:hypothetical protein BGX31_010896 [Mortierella sp. GBA43]|nr:hypothetical protein BGX31_010896 [Mortierella sp. GBA43]